MTKAEIANGNGVRVALWVAGCNHHCKNCHNPESWSCNSGELFTEDDLHKLIKELSLPYYDGLTLTGGDPLHPSNVRNVEYIIKTIKQVCPNKTIWCYTGYEFEQVRNLEVMKYIDVLVDGRYVDELRDITLSFRGSSNQRIISVQESLRQNKIVLWEQ